MWYDLCSGPSVGSSVSSGVLRTASCPICLFLHPQLHTFDTFPEVLFLLVTSWGHFSHPFRRSSSMIFIQVPFCLLEPLCFILWFLAPLPHSFLHPVNYKLRSSRFLSPNLLLMTNLNGIHGKGSVKISTMTDKEHVFCSFWTVWCIFKRVGVLIECNHPLPFWQF